MNSLFSEIIVNKHTDLRAAVHGINEGGDAQMLAVVLRIAVITDSGPGWGFRLKPGCLQASG
jgi:hypothetical protein